MPTQQYQLTSKFVFNLMPEKLDGNIQAGKHIRTVKNLSGLGHLIELDREHISRILKFAHGEINGNRMAHAVPFSNAGMSVSKVVRRYIIQRDQDIVIGMLWDEIARGRRSVQDDRREIRSVRRLYIINESVELMFHFFTSCPQNRLRQSRLRPQNRPNHFRRNCRPNCCRTTNCLSRRSQSR